MSHLRVDIRRLYGTIRHSGKMMGQWWCQMTTSCYQEAFCVLTYEMIDVPNERNIWRFLHNHLLYWRDDPSCKIRLGLGSGSAHVTRASFWGN